MTKRLILLCVAVCMAAACKGDGIQTDWTALDAVTAPSEAALFPDGAQLWTEDDALSILDEAGKRYTARLKKGAGTDVGSFRLSGGVSPKYALYPASSSFSLGEDGRPLVNLDAARDGSAPPPFYAEEPASGSSWMLRCLTGTLHVTMENVPAEAAVLQFAADKVKLSGSFPVPESDGTPAIPMLSTEAADSTVSVTLNGAASVRFPLPDGTYGNWSLTLLDSGKQVLAQSRGGALRIWRGEVTDQTVSFHSDTDGGSTIMDLIPEDGEW